VVLGLIILILLVLGALAFVTAPFLRGDARGHRQDKEDALSAKRAAVQLLAELDHDRQTGKLLAGDYEAQRREVESRAIRAMKDLDAIAGTTQSDPLEQLIQAERNRLKKEARP
jgi:cytochrome c-type biogenesis protein CcmI